jgi:tRNA(fMet)-specific endonuclease VapC
MVHRFLLDTNAVIAFLDAPTTSPISERCRRVGFDTLALSTVVLQELYYGAFNSDERRKEFNLQRLEMLSWTLAQYDAADARETGRIRSILRRAGRPIGPYDVMIAGQALTRGWTVVTNNTGEFARVEGLKLEDWSLPA